jgi:hypothetical protein
MLRLTIFQVVDLNEIQPNGGLKRITVPVGIYSARFMPSPLEGPKNTWIVTDGIENNPVGASEVWILSQPAIFSVTDEGEEQRSRLASQPSRSTRRNPSIQSTQTHKPSIIIQHDFSTRMMDDPLVRTVLCVLALLFILLVGFFFVQVILPITERR